MHFRQENKGDEIWGPTQFGELERRTILRELGSKHNLRCLGSREQRAAGITMIEGAGEKGNNYPGAGGGINTITFFSHPSLKHFDCG